MKILIVSSSASVGGAAIAARRLHECFLRKGLDSKFLVMSQDSPDNGINTVYIPFRKLRTQLFQLEQRFLRFIYPNMTSSRFSTSITSIRQIPKAINEFNPDIVHLHWVQSGLLGIDEISKIEKPIVWSLHDVWAFSGGCHYNENCINFRNGCGNCKVLGSNQPKDLSRLVFKAKMKSYTSHGNITFVGLSRWITSLAKESPLTVNKVVNLPNSIDTKIYRPVPSDHMPFLPGFNSKGNNVLIAAMSFVIKRKGLQEFIESVEYVTNDFDLITLGTVNADSLGIKQRIVNAGFISSNDEMVQLYSAVSVTVVPSLEENLSNVIMESLACGTPVVAFNVGGNSDLISHKVNGYLANAFDVKDLAQGIDWVLNNMEEQNLSENSVDIVRENFDYSVVANKYKQFYQNILKI